MKVEFLKKFSKDLDNLKLKHVKLSLIHLIDLWKWLTASKRFPILKKLKGHKTAYRTRIGDYRLGFFFDNSTITLARFLHRKDIYKIFP